MKLQNWKKSWDKLPSKKKFEIGISIWTGSIVIFFVILLKMAGEI